MAKRSYHRREWEEWYEDAKTYRKEHGDLLVPGLYRTDKGYLLGRWIERQRALYNGTNRRNSVLTEERIALLGAIDMVWRLEYRFPWKEWMSSVFHYYESHGNLRVPADYMDGDYALGNWIKEQRKLHARGVLSKDQIADLEKYGMVWIISRHRPWIDWYADACLYYEEHGDLLVPYGYRTPEGYNLFVWVESQREKYGGKYPSKGKLSKEQIDKLNLIGMEWQNKWQRIRKAKKDSAKSA